MKIQAKTTLLFTLITLSVFLVLTLTVYYFSNLFAHNDFYKRLELRARIAEKFNFEKDHSTIESFRQIQQQYLEKLPDENSFVIRLTAGDQLPAGKPKLPSSYVNEIIRADGGTAYYQDKLLHYAGVFHADSSGRFLVIASATNRYRTEIMDRLRGILLITVGIATVLIYFVGRYFSNRTFAPFRSITQQVNTISEVNLQLRLDQPPGSDEIAELIHTFNNMLDRLETAFEAQNNFISNASHELRTPLTTIMAEADYALLKDRQVADYQESLRQVYQQAEKLQHITTGLLSLATTSFDGIRQQWEPLRLDSLLKNVGKNVLEILPAASIHYLFPEVPQPVRVNGNADLLSIAIGNIVLNACKYSRNGPVAVEFNQHQNFAVIKIVDRGIGIPDSELPRVKDPFFRASNTGPFKGFGIGLPLSNNIIRIHHGNIAIHSKLNEGTTVLIQLPLAAENHLNV